MCKLQEYNLPEGFAVQHTPYITPSSLVALDVKHSRTFLKYKCDPGLEHL